MEPNGNANDTLKACAFHKHLNDAVDGNAFVQVCKQPLYFCFEISTGETFPLCEYVL